MKFFAVLILGFFTFTQCKPQPSQEEVLDFAYLQQNCVNCHTWKESSGRAAPSLADIRNAYRETTENEESFWRGISPSDAPGMPALGSPG